MYYPTAKSYFSGAGLMDLGMQRAGIEITQPLEVDKHCCETLSLNFNHKVENIDIRNKAVISQEKSDIIIGTYPCTKYSRLPIYTEQEQEMIFFFRHITIEQPEAYVVENVPGMKKFPVVMEAMTKLPNYYINIFCPLDALNWLPQKRKRLILIGTKRNVRIEEPRSKKRIKLKEIVESAPEMHIPKYVLDRINGKYRDRPIISDPKKDDVAPTCVAHYSKDLSTRLVIDKSHPLGMRPYTVKEYARLQGVPDWFKFSRTEKDAYRQIGNGVAVPVAQWIGNQLMKYFN